MILLDCLIAETQHNFFQCVRLTFSVPIFTSNNFCERFQNSVRYGENWRF